MILNIFNHSEYILSRIAGRVKPSQNPPQGFCIVNQVNKVLGRGLYPGCRNSIVIVAPRVGSAIRLVLPAQ